MFLSQNQEQEIKLMALIKGRHIDANSAVRNKINAIEGMAFASIKQSETLIACTKSAFPHLLAIAKALSAAHATPVKIDLYVTEFAVGLFSLALDKAEECKNFVTLLERAVDDHVNYMDDLFETQEACEANKENTELMKEFFHEEIVDAASKRQAYSIIDTVRRFDGIAPIKVRFEVADASENPQRSVTLSSRFTSSGFDTYSQFCDMLKQRLENGQVKCSIHCCDNRLFSNLTILTIIALTENESDTQHELNSAIESLLSVAGELKSTLAS